MLVMLHYFERGRPEAAMDEHSCFGWRGSWCAFVTAVASVCVCMMCEASQRESWPLYVCRWVWFVCGWVVLWTETIAPQLAVKGMSSVSPKISLLGAMAQLFQHHVSALPVLADDDSSNVLGFVTPKTILDFVVSNHREGVGCVGIGVGVDVGGMAMAMARDTSGLPSNV